MTDPYGDGWLSMGNSSAAAAAPNNAGDTMLLQLANWSAGKDGTGEGSTDGGPFNVKTMVEHLVKAEKHLLVPMEVQTIRRMRRILRHVKAEVRKVNRWPSAATRRSASGTDRGVFDDCKTHISMHGSTDMQQLEKKAVSHFYSFAKEFPELDSSWEKKAVDAMTEITEKQTDCKPPNCPEKFKEWVHGPDRAELVKEAVCGAYKDRINNQSTPFWGEFASWSNFEFCKACVAVNGDGVLELLCPWRLSNDLFKCFYIERALGKEKKKGEAAWEEAEQKTKKAEDAYSKFATIINGLDAKFDSLRHFQDTEYEKPLAEIKEALKHVQSRGLLPIGSQAKLQVWEDVMEAKEVLGTATTAYAKVEALANMAMNKKEAFLASIKLVALLNNALALVEIQDLTKGQLQSLDQYASLTKDGAEYLKNMYRDTKTSGDFQIKKQFDGIYAGLLIKKKKINEEIEAAKKKEKEDAALEAAKKKEEEDAALEATAKQERLTTLFRRLKNQNHGKVLHKKLMDVRHRLNQANEAEEAKKKEEDAALKEEAAPINPCGDEPTDFPKEKGDKYTVEDLFFRMKDATNLVKAEEVLKNTEYLTTKLVKQACEKSKSKNEQIRASMRPAEVEWALHAKYVFCLPCLHDEDEKYKECATEMEKLVEECWQAPQKNKRTAA